MAATAKKTVSESTRPRRADARRNIEAILEAATECLAEDPDVSMADIATAAGVGRITLYGHFNSRATLVDAVLVKTIADADGVLAAADLSGEPPEALARLVSASWQFVHQFKNILHAAKGELPADRIRRVHDKVLRRLQRIIDDGQKTGAFRTDLPKRWLVTTSFSLMHGAAEEVGAGTLRADDASELLVKTLLSVFTPPPVTKRR